MPKNNYRVLWSEIAINDLEEIVTYIARDSPANALKVHGKLKDKADLLETYPLRGRIVPELARLGMRAWREIISKPYRIIYRLDKNIVYVPAVLDSRRDLDDLLLNRMVRIKP